MRMNNNAKTRTHVSSGLRTMINLLKNIELAVMSRVFLVEALIVERMNLRKLLIALYSGMTVLVRLIKNYRWLDVSLEPL